MKIKNFLKKNLFLKLKQKKVNLTGFTFVELLISISIITVLSFIAYSYYSGFEQKAVNAKVKDDLKTLDTFLVMLKQTKRELPEPAGNNSFFDNSGAYSHSSSGAFGVYGKITKNILPDFSNSLKVGKINRYYAYGKNIDGNKYNLAGVIKEDDEFETILVGNYEKSESLGQPDSLIKSYDGPEFVTDKSKNNFPYNPEERKLTAKITDFNGKIIINDTKTYNNPNELKNIKLYEGDKIKFEGTDNSQVAKIYYSDGSSSELSSKTEIILENMDYKGEDDLFTNIKIFLSSGKIYTKAAKLAKQSELEVYTTDTMVAVRGTIFSVEKNPSSKTEVELEKGKIAISKITETNENSLKQKLKTKKFTEISKQTITGVTGITTETKDDGTIESVLEVTETESPKSVEIKNGIITASEIECNGEFKKGCILYKGGKKLKITEKITGNGCSEYSYHNVQIYDFENNIKLRILKGVTEKLESNENEKVDDVKCDDKKEDEQLKPLNWTGYKYEVISNNNTSNISSTSKDINIKLIKKIQLEDVKPDDIKLDDIKKLFTTSIDENELLPIIIEIKKYKIEDGKYYIDYNYSINYAENYNILPKDFTNIFDGGNGSIPETKFSDNIQKCFEISIEEISKEVEFCIPTSEFN